MEMKSVLLSVQPKWCELIASGKKTIEVRKTRPKIDTTFKCYIYETKGKKQYFSQPLPIPYNEGKGKVIGEFICDFVDKYIYDYCTHPEIGLDYDCGDNWWEISYEDLENACLTETEFRAYAFPNDLMYGWHISDLVIYDKPKELSEFITICPEWEKEYFDTKCLRCKYYFSNCADMRHECTVEGEKPLKRPPQSWCYVEGAEGK